MNKDAVITIKLQSLTPVWTGNAFGKTEEIKASSILGSIRWWYEIIYRSLGKRVCKNKCKLQQNDFIKDLLDDKTVDKALDNQNICPACKLFGCNGWAGKIKVVVDDSGNKRMHKVEIGARENERAKRILDGLIFTNQKYLKLLIYPVKELEPKEIELLRIVLKIISENAAIGGRTAQGNGVVKLIPEGDRRKNNIKLVVKEELGNKEYPALDNVFFLKLHLKFDETIDSIIRNNCFWTGNSTESSDWEYNWRQYGFIPIGFHIRDTIRRIKKDVKSRHELFGQRNEGGSKIFVSHGYKIDETTAEVRIWGYSEKNRIKELVSEISEKLTSGEDLKNNLFSKEYRKNLTVSINGSSNGLETFDEYLKEV